MADHDALNQELEALQVALKTEQDGYQYYMESSQRSDHPVVKKFFASVAEDENEHIRLINEFYRSMKEQSGDSRVKVPEAPGDYRQRLKTIFEEAQKDLKQHVKPDAGVVDVYQHAMDLETRAAQFYKQRGEATSFENARRFYDWLFHFESDHYRMFSETLSYLQNPEQWFQDYEKSIFEG